MSAANGGPAFPHAPEQRRPAGPAGWELVVPGDEPGMTLRDYMAAKAMHGCMNGTWPDGSDRDEIARRAYAMADAMLRERAK